MFEVFKEKILKVKKPKHIQYLFFYLCSKSFENGKPLSKKYFSLLIKIVINDKENTFLRKNAC